MYGVLACCIAIGALNQANSQQEKSPMLTAVQLQESKLL